VLPGCFSQKTVAHSTKFGPKASAHRSSSRSSVAIGNVSRHVAGCVLGAVIGLPLLLIEVPFLVVTPPPLPVFRSNDWRTRSAWAGVNNVTGPVKPFLRYSAAENGDATPTPALLPLS
jgi:hypothetical protein